MRHIDNPELAYFSVEKAASDLGISKSEFILQAMRLKIKLMINISTSQTLIATITTNLNGHPITSPPLKTNVLVGPGFPKTMRMLYISPEEAKEIIKFENFEKYQFDLIAILSKSLDIFINITPKDFYRCYNDAAYRKACNGSDYDFCDYKNPFYTLGVPNDSEIESTPFCTTDKPITIKFEDLRISRASFEAILLDKEGSTIDYGVFIPGPWASSKLADLNEASTLFFGPDSTGNMPLSEDKKQQIRSWFRGKWTKNTSNVLFDYAMLAIIPDQYHPQPPLLDDTLKALIEQNNTYASRTLMLINSVAAIFHQEEQSNSMPTSNKDATIELEKIYGLNARMAAQAAIIICPDKRSRTLHTRKS
jgi:hypothetical protein